MAKYIFAFVALSALSCVLAIPAYHAPKPSYGLPPPPPVAYVETPTSIPVPAPSYGSVSYGAPVSGYGAPAPVYGASSIPASIFQAIPLPALTHGAKPSVLVGAQSNPVATASASSKAVGLKPGKYTQVVIPSWAVLVSEPLPTSADIPAIPLPAHSAYSPSAVY